MEHGLTRYNPAIEGLERDQLLDLQWRKLRYQLAWLVERNPFYAARLRNAGIEPHTIRSIDEFRERVPFCDKGDLLADQQVHPPFGSRLGVRPDQVVMTYLTSGTSGVGQEVYGHTWSDAILSGTKYLEGPLYWIGLRKGDRIFAMTPVATLAFGLMVMETFRLAGFQPFEVFTMPSAAKLELMQRFPPHALVITPVHLARLTMICADQGIDQRESYSSLKGILIAGQAYPTELAARCEEAWGTKLFETYGSSQGNGHMATTCEYGAVTPEGGRGGMHIYEHRILLEVLDPDTGEHVSPGEEGMAVVTSLEEEGSPLLRFRTNDRVRYLGHGCPCGRSWAMIEAGTVSRFDEMVKVRGMNIWPQAVDGVVFARSEIDEYVADVYVDDQELERIHLRYALTEEARLAMGDVARQQLGYELVQSLKVRTNVTFDLSEVSRSELPVFEFKAVRWTDTRQQDLMRKVW